MPHPPWNENYAEGNLPWDTGEADPQLVRFVEAGGVKPGRGLEVGSGTGTDAIWLAERGFDMLGLDVAPLAVERARARAGGRARCRFEVADFLATAPAADAYDFVYDRGCWHVFDEPAERARFAARVAATLKPGAVWLSLSGSTEGGPRDMGPPRRSVRDIAEAIEPELELLDLHTFEFELPIGPAKAWACVSRRRTAPAVPSSRHE